MIKVTVEGETIEEVAKKLNSYANMFCDAQEGLEDNRDAKAQACAAAMGEVLKNHAGRAEKASPEAVTAKRKTKAEVAAARKQEIIKEVEAANAEPEPEPVPVLAKSALEAYFAKGGTFKDRSVHLKEFLAATQAAGSAELDQQVLSEICNYWMQKIGGPAVRAQVNKYAPSVAQFTAEQKSKFYAEFYAEVS